MKEGEPLYFDTSALLPYYREEPFSERIENFLRSLNPPVLISDLTRVEFVSAVSRWVRMGEITESQANLVENAFFGDIRCGLFLCLSLKEFHYRQAEKWLSGRKTSLRALDALHLACALFARAELITCDTVLSSAASVLGVKCYQVS